MLFGCVLWCCGGIRIVRDGGWRGCEVIGGGIAFLCFEGFV